MANSKQKWVFVIKAQLSIHSFQNCQNYKTNIGDDPDVNKYLPFNNYIMMYNCCLPHCIGDKYGKNWEHKVKDKKEKEGCKFISNTGM